MALSVLFSTRRGKVGVIELDAVLSETHGADAEVTKHPVEKGAAVTDHIRPLPRSLRMEGLVSNTPVPKEAREKPDLEARAGTAYKQLMEIIDGGQLITVVTALNTYTNMAITSSSIPRNAQLGDVLQFSLALTQVRVVASKIVELKKTVTPRGQNKQHKGKQPTRTADDAITNKSILKKVADTETGDTFLKSLGLR